MTSALAVQPGSLIGNQSPRVVSVPEYVSSSGQEAIELCRMAGLDLDPGQELVLQHALGEKANGKWAAYEVGINESRQNGKGVILEARELTGLFLLQEPLIIHSAHMFDTSLEHFNRLLQRIEDTPDFDRRVQSVKRSHGEEGIVLKGGRSRIRFRTRTKGGGRGFTCDLLILDEAMEIAEPFYSALLPTLSARSITGNPQVYLTGSAVDQLIHENGVVFARIRERGLAGGDDSLAYFEWSADVRNAEGQELKPDELTYAQLSDPELWAQANPGLGIRISAEHIGYELRSMSNRGFAVERLGIGDWPRTDGIGATMITPAQWAALVDEDSSAQDPIVIAYDVTPDRKRSAIGIAGRREDGKLHVEVAQHRSGTGWVPETIADYVQRFKPSAVVCDAIGPAVSLVHKLERLGVDVQTIDGPTHAQACGLFYDGVEQQELRHRGEAELTSAIRGAVSRPLGDRWAWSRKNSATDISPLVAVTLALGWFVSGDKPSQPFVSFVPRGRSRR